MQLTILIPTIGRPTLRRTLESNAPQLADGDEVLLIHDGPDAAAARAVWEVERLPGRLIVLEDGPHNDWGNCARNRTLDGLHDAGTPGYVVYLDDDDTLTHGALQAIRGAIASDPGGLFLFRLQAIGGAIRWREPVLRVGEIGTVCFAHPVHVPLGRFTPGLYAGDFDFIRDTVRLNPDRRLHWRAEITTLVRHALPPRPASPLKIDIGGGRYPREGYLNVDQCETADVRIDLEAVGRFKQPLPFANESVASVYTSHCLEHVAPYGGLLQEIARVCHAGADVEIRVPHWNNEMANCAGHKQTVSEVQVRHWCDDFPQDWFGECPRRLQLIETEHVPHQPWFDRIREAFPDLDDETIYGCFANTCHEIRFTFTVVDAPDLRP